MINRFDIIIKNGVRKIIDTEAEISSGRAFQNDINDYTVYSLDTFDHDYETCLCKGHNNKWIIVERYDTFEDMKKSHKKWCDYCMTNPKGVMSVNSGEYEEF